MAATIVDALIPLPADHPCGHQSYPLASFNYSVRVFSDNTWVNTPTVIYFHGSGATAPILDTSPLVVRLKAQGIRVMAVMALGAWNSSESPWKYGYGNVNSPQFHSLWCKDAWWVETGVLHCLTNYIGSAPWCVLGHSRGGSAALAWAAGYSGRTSFPWSGFRGIFSNGSTVGGLGDLTWNDVQRNIGTITNMIALGQCKTLMSYGDNDAFAPPDYVRRLALAIPEGKDTYLVSPGAAPHAWVNEEPWAAFCVAWCQQLLSGGPILDRNGSAAVMGGFAP